MSRPKGSKNKPKISKPLADTLEINNVSPVNEGKQGLEASLPIIKRGRGRPKGSKNKSDMPMFKEIKKAENISLEKQELMNKIYEAKPHLKVLEIDLNKFTIEQLQYHYDTKIRRL